MADYPDAQYSGSAASEREDPGKGEGKGQGKVPGKHPSGRPWTDDEVDEYHNELCLGIKV